MDARYLLIEAKHRQNGSELASIADFSVTSADSLDPTLILSRPNLSLYCLDDANRRAIFVELPETINLSRVPFIYQTQYEQAERLIAVPYATFCELAHQLPKIERLIMIYSTGRSGSTLLSTVFNELDDVLSLSEPDVGVQFIDLRAPDGSSDAELRELLDCTVRLLFKPTPSKSASICVLKLRSQALKAIDLFQAVFPSMKNLYSYRDAIGFTASFYRIFKSFQVPEYAPADEFFAERGRLMAMDITHLRAYLEPKTEQLSLPQQFTLWWLGMIEAYLACCAQGIPFLAASYADLNSHRERVLEALFTYCDLPTDQVPAALVAFDRDSQAGSALGRENPSESNSIRLTDAQINEIEAILQRHPAIKSSDFVVPGSVTL